MNERTKNILFFMGGLAVGAALPVIIPAVIEGGRPLAKALVKHSSLALERLHVASARVTEWVEDLFAEVRSETAAPVTGTAVDTRSASDFAQVSVSIPDKKVLS